MAKLRSHKTLASSNPVLEARLAQEFEESDISVVLAGEPSDPMPSLRGHLDPYTEARVLASRLRPGPPLSLSPRELEIVALVVQGFCNSEICDKLKINQQTVKNHVHKSCKKLGVRDRLELALYAIYHRLCLR